MYCQMPSGPVGRGGGRQHHENVSGWREEGGGEEDKVIVSIAIPAGVTHCQGHILHTFSAPEVTTTITSTRPQEN